MIRNNIYKIFPEPSIDLVVNDIAKVVEENPTINVTNIAANISEECVDEAKSVVDKIIGQKMVKRCFAEVAKNNAEKLAKEVEEELVGFVSSDDLAADLSRYPSPAPKASNWNCFSQASVQIVPSFKK